MVRPQVHSTKHQVQYPIDSVATGINKVILLAQGVERTTANAAKEVAEGSTIKAVFVELWLQNQGTLGEAIVTVTKDTNNELGPTFTEMSALFSYVNKKNIFFTHQGLTSNDGVSGPIAPVRQWIPIPKGKQRFGLGDTLVLTIANVSSNSLNTCGIAIYKEYS